MRPSRQDLEAGDGSTNLQVQGDVVVSTGLTPEEARAIATDVFRENFLKLGTDAADLAAGRAARLIDDVVNELKANFPQRLRAAADPDVQYALFEAQSGFARSGEEELAETLRALLVERAGETTGTTRAIALNEAIEAAPRLTLSQRRAIAVCFFLRYTGWRGGLDLDQYYGALIAGLAPLAGALPQNKADYQHIASIGAGSEFIGVEFGAALINRAPGCFVNGFVPGVYPELEALETEPPVFVACLRDHERLQLNATQKPDIEVLATAAGLPDRAAELEAIFGTGQMAADAVQEEFLQRTPGLSAIVDAWHSTSLNTLSLTSKGIALGYTYWQQLTRNPAALSIWLPD